MSAAAPQATYVYGVLRADDEPPNIKGIGGAPLQEVTSDGIAALVSDMSDHELKLGREEMTTHARVLEEALQNGTVLPMRFGVVMAGEPAVKSALLDAHLDELKQQLSEMTGKVELRVRAVYDEQNLMREVVQEDQDIARLRDSLRGAPEDATYYGRIQLGEMVAKAVERKRDDDAAQLLDILAPLALAVQAGEPNNERIVLNASFLVERDDMAEFDDAVDAVGRAQADRMRLKYTGPLPPHSFVRLRTEA
jgi:Gas vesicle synthesis protein GvpL/GvpF